MPPVLPQHNSTSDGAAQRHQSQEGRYLTIGEISADLRVTPPTVTKMIHDGLIPALRIGGRGTGVRYRIPLEDYLKFKAENAVRGTRGRG